MNIPHEAAMTLDERLQCLNVVEQATEYLKAQGQWTARDQHLFCDFVRTLVLGQDLGVIGKEVKVVDGLDEVDDPFLGLF